MFAHTEYASMWFGLFKRIEERQKKSIILSSLNTMCLLPIFTRWIARRTDGTSLIDVLHANGLLMRFWNGLLASVPHLLYLITINVRLGWFRKVHEMRYCCWLSGRYMSFFQYSFFVNMSFAVVIRDYWKLDVVGGPSIESFEYKHILTSKCNARKIQINSFFNRCY